MIDCSHCAFVTGGAPPSVPPSCRQLCLRHDEVIATTVPRRGTLNVEKRELEHTEQVAKIGDRIKLRFPGDDCVIVSVVSMSPDRLVISENGMSLEFARIFVPFDLKETVLGDVFGELKMWRAVNFPNSPPAMIVENMGRVC